MPSKVCSNLSLSCSSAAAEEDCSLTAEDSWLSRAVVLWTCSVSVCAWATDSPNAKIALPNRRRKMEFFIKWTSNRSGARLERQERVPAASWISNRLINGKRLTIDKPRFLSAMAGNLGRQYN